MTGMTGNHGSPMGPKPVADAKARSARAVRRPFHYGIFHARDGQDFAPVEILGTAPLPITHLERHKRSGARTKHSAASGGVIRARVSYLLIGLASKLSAQLARLVRLFRIRSLH